MSPRRELDFEYAIKKDVRNNPIVREIDQARQRQLWRTAGISAVLVLVLLFSAWQTFELIRHGYDIQRLERERASARPSGSRTWRSRSSSWLRPIATRPLSSSA